jgi:competence protein ComEC
MEQPREYFKLWGLSHYLARSGLHLVIIAALWYFILTILGFSYFLRNIVITIFILIYHILTLASIPFIRSLYMFIFYKICIFFDWQINALHLLNLTTFIILLLNPIQLFFLDFQLSFGLTYALIWISYVPSRKQIL